MAASGERSKVLQVTRLLPFPASSGGRLRTLGLASALSAFADVDIVGTGTGATADDTHPYRRVIAVDHPPWRRYVGAVRNLVSGRSVRQGLWVNPAVAASLVEIVAANDYDAIFMEELGSFVYLPSRGRLPPLVHSSQNAEHQLAERMLASVSRLKSFSRWEVSRLRAAETDAIRRAAATVVVSELDRQCFASLAPDQSAKPLIVVPNYVTAPSAVPSPVASSGDVVYVASFAWRPNAQGARWLADEVVPLLRADGVINDVSCVGSKMSDDFRTDMAAAGVATHPDVASVWPYLSAARVGVVPLHVGGGTRIKIVEAWSAGLPVVSTTVGAEGLGVIPGEDIIIADDARAFADAVSGVLANDALYTRLRDNGLARAATLTWSAATPILHDLVATVTARTTGASR